MCVFFFFFWGGGGVACEGSLKGFRIQGLRV